MTAILYDDPIRLIIGFTRDDKQWRSMTSLNSGGAIIGLLSYVVTDKVANVPSPSFGAT